MGSPSAARRRFWARRLSMKSPTSSIRISPSWRRSARRLYRIGDPSKGAGLAPCRRDRGEIGLEQTSTNHSERDLFSRRLGDDDSSGSSARPFHGCALVQSIKPAICFRSCSKAMAGRSPPPQGGSCSPDRAQVRSGSSRSEPQRLKYGIWGWKSLRSEERRVGKEGRSRGEA